MYEKVYKKQVVWLKWTPTTTTTRAKVKLWLQKHCWRLPNIQSLGYLKSKHLSERNTWAILKPNDKIFFWIKYDYETKPDDAVFNCDFSDADNEQRKIRYIFVFPGKLCIRERPSLRKILSWKFPFSHRSLTWPPDVKLMILEGEMTTIIYIYSGNSPCMCKFETLLALACSDSPRGDRDIDVTYWIGVTLFFHPLQGNWGFRKWC